MTEITVRGITATIRNGVWTTADAVLAIVLQASVPDLSHEYVPDRDHAYAVYAAQQLGGAVTKHVPPKTRPGVVY